MSFEQIWAPWRLAYIVVNKEAPAAGAALAMPPDADPECFLCQAAAAPEAPERHVVHRGKQVLTLLNRYPYNNGHLLVAPARHVAKLGDLSADEQLEVSQSLTRMVALLETVLRPEGFNIGLNLGRVAGAGLPGHIHWHIVPRWSGDTNFMPVLAAVNVVPQSLEALHELLTAEIARMG